ncbi:hypothetical protein Pcinc_039401 [Petrolisthes cinctipes]|uniref:V-type proton ATPase subunit S1/VOA1 transmembrane domain-containing protein n=1 Tax=Petrolisthes cinctipes TaxID=88211 RepID=A0AAE1BRB4_PETCI|nr:hypothetical protein Pcinc_039401 [Petrolisthes cinctipes]
MIIVCREGIMAAREVILSIIFLVSLASCGVEAKQHVPVLVWNNNQASDGVPAVSALQYINYNTFQSKYLHAFQPKNILLFIQDALSIEDLSSHAGEFQHVNRLMQEGHSLYLPNVEDAAHLAHDLPTHGYSVEVLEPGIPVAGLNLKQQDDNLIVVKLPSTLTNPSRKRALQKADEVIVNVISKIGEQREFTVIFTGLKPSVENKGEEQYEERIRVSRSLQQSKPEYPVGFHYSKCVYIYFFNDMVLNFYQGNDTRSEKKLIYSVAINESLAMDEGELTGDCTQKHQSITLKYNNVVINNHTHSQLDLHYHFQLVGDEWSFTYVHTILTPGSTDTVDFKPQNSDITGIPIRMSYSCSQKITLRSNNTDPETNSYYTLVLNGVQMQPRTENFPAIKFSGAWDCVGFFTVPILSSVFVTFLLLVILSVGMFMLSDIKTMDRFDDPKRPAILVPTAGTD